MEKNIEAPLQMSARSSSGSIYAGTFSPASTSSTTTPSPRPDSRKLNVYLDLLTDLAVDVLNPAAYNRRCTSGLLAVDKLAKVQDRINKYLAKFTDYDFTVCHERRQIVGLDGSSATGGVGVYVVQITVMQTLMRMIETTLALSHERVAWPVLKLDDGMKVDVQRVSYEEVDDLVFRGKRRGEVWGGETSGRDKDAVVV
ncbi:hypothetical protein EJ02DRAFT_455274 [Clathrospora elynae]|uniref:Uncharacterized protein n=1 Tax=Clathrospora elynae TaxID=706981 RepID=A0A6A5SL14_9PLEO|nr:hypothetical protein EJ02DRAFT_455274 [Clathrospora elynae]